MTDTLQLSHNTEPATCCLCGEPGERYRMGTMYLDDERNYVTACKRCQPYIDRDVQAQFEDLH